MADQYHHGNLKQDLIDHGVKIINKDGEQALSLRKVAAACKVSHAAPYAHFKDKEELLEAIKASVTDQFSNYLRESVEKMAGGSAEAAILEMGKSYIRFFIEHQDYFKFLFFNQKITVHLIAGKEYEEDYPPYRMLKRLFEQYLQESGSTLSDEQKEIELIKLWSTVQGVASLVCMENVVTKKSWEAYLDDILH